MKRHQGAFATSDIPESAAEWDIYNKLRGSGLAAHRLTRALEKELTNFEADVPKVGPRKALLDAYDRWCTAAEKNAQYGAMDTEPRATARSAFRRFARACGYDVDNVL